MKLDKYTVGRRYGKALFELAIDSNQAEEIYQDLVSLRQIYEQVPGLGNMLSDVRLEHQGLLLGSVTTAVPLSDEQRIQLEKNVAKTMNYQSVELKQIVDSSIIGGAIVEANHRVIDGSIRTQLENMRNQLNR